MSSAASLPAIDRFWRRSGQSSGVALAVLAGLDAFLHQADCGVIDTVAPGERRDGFKGRGRPVEAPSLGSKSP